MSVVFVVDVGGWERVGRGERGRGGGKEGVNQGHRESPVASDSIVVVASGVVIFLFLLSFLF